MTNPYYTPSANPTTGALGSSAVIRAEFAAISAGFDKLPGFPLTAGAAIVVGANGTSLTTTGGLSLAGTLTTTGAFNTTLAQGATVTLTLPLVSGTLATLAGTETLSNKTFGSNVALGTPVSGVATNLTGTAAGLTAGTVTTNANLSGPITSVGNVTSVAAQSGTGSTFVMQASPTINSPTLSSPVLGTPASGTLTNCTIPAAQVTAGTMQSGMVLVAPALGTPASGVLTNCTVATASFESNGTGVASTGYVDAAIPCGSVLPYAGSSAPTGYLLCDGSAVSRTGANAALFALLGTTFGAGNGSTTFNLPDLRGRVPAGPDGGAGRLTATTMSGTSVGSTVGQQTNTASTTSSGSMSGSNAINYGNIGGQTSGGWSGGAPAAAGADFNALTTSSLSSITTNPVNGNFNIGVSGSVSGTSSAFSDVQPTIVLSYIIKT